MTSICHFSSNSITSIRIWFSPASVTLFNRIANKKSQHNSFSSLPTTTWSLSKKKIREPKWKRTTSQSLLPYNTSLLYMLIIVKQRDSYLFITFDKRPSTFFVFFSFLFSLFYLCQTQTWLVLNSLLETLGLNLCVKSLIKIRVNVKPIHSRSFKLS